MTSISLFQSTLPTRGATILPGRRPRARCVSIHAPHTGSDLAMLAGGGGAGSFNPRSPHGERPGSGCARINTGRFQSTLPTRGATLRPQFRTEIVDVSIHAPHTGSDVQTLFLSHRRPQFQSTLPTRGATTEVVVRMWDVLLVSIHAPHTGSDITRRAKREVIGGFNPRSPHGERLSNLSNGLI